MSNNYGTLPSSQNGTPENETRPLLDHQRTSLIHRFKSHFTAPVSTTNGDIALLFCYLITGLLDSSATNTWGAFVSMQTGNTVYLGLGILHPGSSSDRWLRGLIAIASFCTGSFAYSRFHRFFGGRRRWVIVISYFTQFLFVLVAAVLIQLDPNSTPPKEREIDFWTALPLVMLAFQAGGQAVISRVLGFGALTSVVLTSIYCDLFSDEKVFSWSKRDPERNRRAGAVVLLFLGAMIGGVWARSEIGLEGALWTAVGLKGFVVGAWCVWKREKEVDMTE